MRQNKIILFGPCKKINKSSKSDSWMYYSNYNIIKAYFVLHGKKIDLPHNKILISKNDDGTFMIYHSYKYVNKSKMCSGRWYHAKTLLFDPSGYPFADITKNKITMVIDDYEDNNEIRPAKFVIYIKVGILSDI